MGRFPRGQRLGCFVFEAVFYITQVSPVVLVIALLQSLKRLGSVSSLFLKPFLKTMYLYYLV